MDSIPLWTYLYESLLHLAFGYPFLHVDLGHFSAKILSNIFYACSFYLSSFFFNLMAS